jgi:predicted nucleic acid-binding protein
LATHPSFLLDTTVYIDQVQGRLPESVDWATGRSTIWHSTVTESELLAGAGLLNPNHPGSLAAIKEISDSIEHRMAHRIINPDRQVWRDAGILSGTLARLQQYGKADQRRALNDALIFLSAAKHGLTVLTRNIADYDLLLQLAPHGKAVFYEIDSSKKPF